MLRFYSFAPVSNIVYFVVWILSINSCISVKKHTELYNNYEWQIINVNSSWDEHKLSQTLGNSKAANIKNVIVNFETDTFKYKNNTLFQGFDSLILKGNGSKLIKSVVKSRYGEEHRPISFKSPLRSRKRKGIIYRDPAKIKLSDKKKVFLIDNDKISKIKKGDRLILYSWEQQFDGFPPNPRNFLYTKVDKINNNEISVRDEIDLVDNTYDYSLKKGSISYGGVRMINLEEGDYNYSSYIEVNEIEFQSNSDVSNNLLFLAEHLILKKCTIPALYISMSRKAEIKECKINFIEFDKLVDQIYIENSEFFPSEVDSRQSIFTGATGVNELQIIKSKINGRITVSPRSLIMDSVLIIPNIEETLQVISSYHGQFSIDSVSLSNINILNDHNLDIKRILYFNNYSKVLVDKSYENKLYLLNNKENFKSISRNMSLGTKIYDIRNTRSGIVNKVAIMKAKILLEIYWSAPQKKEPYELIWKQTKSIKKSNITITGKNIPIESNFEVHKRKYYRYLDESF